MVTDYILCLVNQIIKRVDKEKPLLPTLHIFTGKGGVGKTSLCGAFASKLAQQGKRVLIVETGQISRWQSIYQLTLSEKPTEVASHVDIMFLTPTHSRNLFFEHYLGDGFASKVLARKTIQRLLSILPGMEEMAILGNLIGICEKKSKFVYDAVLWDAPATGHVRWIFQTPSLIKSFVKNGFIFDVGQSILNFLQDEKRTKIYIGLLPADFVWQEAHDLQIFLEQQVGVKITAFLVNQLEAKPPILADAHSFIESKETISNQAKKLLNDMLQQQAFAHSIFRHQQDFLQQMKEIKQQPAIVLLSFIDRVQSEVQLIKALADQLRFIKLNEIK